MRIAWIDHALCKIERWCLEEVFQREFDLELVSESSWARFEEEHGPVESYDGLLIHPGLKNQVNAIERIRGLKIPVAFVTGSPQQYDSGEMHVLSYFDKESIVEYFRQTQIPKNQ